MAIDPNVDLRSMVREVLRDVIAARAPQPGCEAVAIACDADLQTFLRRLSTPGVIDAIRAGTLKFALASPALAATVAAPAQMRTAPSARTLSGVISERLLKDMAAGSVLVLGPTAVLTPLAKDVARRLGLKIERNG